MIERMQFLKSYFRMCPKTGKIVGLKTTASLLKPFSFIVGLLALIWFLIRVLPKPSRSTYPCQRTAAPLAAAFLTWMLAAFGATTAMGKAKRHFARSHYGLAALCLLAAIGTMWWSVSMTNETPAQAALMQPQPPNNPMGEAQGIHPGRVAWAHDPESTSWHEQDSPGHWWADENTDQTAVDAMMSAAIRNLTGETSDADAWDALFTHFNIEHGQSNIGYRPGEKIAIKINMNQDSGSSWERGDGMPSPHAIYALIEQLVEKAGVSGEDITIYDATRAIGDPIVNKIRSNPDQDFQDVTIAVAPNRVKSGRVAVSHDNRYPVHVGDSTAYLPTCVTEAKYLINMALLRPHSMFGITLCAKNHFGSTYYPGRGWTPSPMHRIGDRDDPMGTYCALVDLNGHEQLGGKTMLYLIDGLYSARSQGSSVMRYQSMDNHWSSSILASQDMIAIDSVAFDILRNEPNATNVSGNPEGYLHEGALAADPPSGSNYDPENDNVVMKSMGVHEHWNNATDKQYTRNLGTGDGIELMYRRPPFFDGCPGDLEPDGDVDGADLSTIALDYNKSNCNGNCDGDIDGDGDVDASDLITFSADFGKRNCLD